MSVIPSYYNILSERWKFDLSTSLLSSIIFSPTIIMSTTNPGGTLFRLPQEIRDEIYSHYFNKEYTVFWCYCDPGDYEFNLADLAILRTSKPTSSDAKNFLFSKAASRQTTFFYDLDLDPIAKTSTPPTKEATKRMMNVEVIVLMDPNLMAYHAIVGGYADETIYPTSSMDLLCEATIDHFTGISVVRDRFRIEFQVHGHDEYEPFLGFMKTRFFQTLKRMQGFRKLTLVLDMVNRFKDDVSIEDQQDVGEVATELKRYLGPCVAKSLTYERWEDWLHLVYDMEFHPLEFQSESLRAEAATLTKEVKSSRDDSSE